MKYKLEIDRELCTACGNCYSTDPTHFERGPEEKSKLVGGTSNAKSTGTFDDDKIADAKNAADTCPAQAITVTET